MAQRVKFFLAADSGQLAQSGLDLHFTKEDSLACAVTILAQRASDAASGEMKSVDPASQPLAA